MEPLGNNLVERCKEYRIKRKLTSAWKVQSKAKELGEDILIPRWTERGAAQRLRNLMVHIRRESCELSPQCDYCSSLGRSVAHWRR